MKIIAKYEGFNPRRYGNPWVAAVSPNGKIDFSKKIGGYTGAYGKGEAGELYITSPIDGGVYAYGQKDYRGNNGGYEYVKFVNGEFIPVEKNRLVEALSENI